MEMIFRKVDDLEAADRAAVERLLGFPLRQGQRISMTVYDQPPEPPMPPNWRPPESDDDFPPEWNFYDGMTDEEIEELTAAIKQPVIISPPRGLP